MERRNLSILVFVVISGLHAPEGFE